MIHTKRIYEPPDPADGLRILVHRLWPRGLSREAVRVDHWLRAIAPSDELRRWYRHDAGKWPEFQRRFFEELDANPDAVAELRELLAEHPTVTFVFSSRETELNNASALKEYIEAREHTP